MLQSHCWLHLVYYCGCCCCGWLDVVVMDRWNEKKSLEVKSWIWKDNISLIISKTCWCSCWCSYSWWNSRNCKQFCWSRASAKSTLKLELLRVYQKQQIQLDHQRQRKTLKPLILRYDTRFTSLYQKIPRSHVLYFSYFGTVLYHREPDLW